jgi:hypothetical protein
VYRELAERADFSTHSALWSASPILRNAVIKVGVCGNESSSVSFVRAGVAMKSDEIKETPRSGQAKTVSESGYDRYRPVRRFQGWL